MTKPAKLDPVICPYCRTTREEIVKPDARIYNAIATIGITPVGVNKWRVLWCPDCGSLELFLVER